MFDKGDTGLKNTFCKNTKAHILTLKQLVYYFNRKLKTIRVLAKIIWSLIKKDII